MTRKAIYYAAALFATLASAVACQQDEGLDALPEPLGDSVKIKFQADIPAPDTQALGTRAVDPDGGGVRDMTLFCFDNFGLFITTASATLSPQTDFTGTFTVKAEANVPLYTRRIHFVANQNMTDFRESAFINKTESEVLALLEGSAGQMIYWARFACPFISPQEQQGQKSIAELLADSGNKITMLRNHACVSVANPTNNKGRIEIIGLEAYNIYAYGTVAPYDPVNGFEFTLDEWKAADFVTLPQRNAKQSDIRSVTSTLHQYIFEHDNRMDDPLSIILRGRPEGSTEDRYYRVLLIDDKGDFIPVRRNHDYKLHIEGPLSYGQPSFEEALTAAATNNVWISISDRVNEVEDTKRLLRVSKTFSIHNDSEFTADSRSITLYYTIKSKDNTPITLENDRPTVTWLDNTVSPQDFRHEAKDFEDGISADKTEVTCPIVVSPLAMGSNDRLEGTLLVKLGRLQRKIKIVVIKEQSFAPLWMSSGVYGGEYTEPGAGGGTSEQKLAHMTMMFNIPENCPSELFPMKVYITARDLDIRSESGMLLPVVRKGDAEWYQAKDGPADADYKFVLTVHKAGPQRIYFENILGLKEEDYASYVGTVTLESEHFATISRNYTFTNTQHAISVTNVEKYQATDPAVGSLDEYIYYYRVAQKAGAYVRFDMELHEKTNDVADAELGPMVNANANDEFLFYSENLNNYVTGSYNPEEVEIDCLFSPYTEMAAAWQQKRNPNGGRMLMFKPIVVGADPTQGKGKYNLHLYTNRARSAEMIRISSNLANQPAILNFDPASDTNPLYTGTVYRSFLLELTNYTPFRFGARVRYNDGEWLGKEPKERDDDPSDNNLSADVPEEITPLTWSFEPERKVDIAIDVTSFEGPDHKSVDPFGRQFEIYIDAPMLKIDESRLAANNLLSEQAGSKLKADPSVPGRFIYTVDADREAERAFGMEPALNTDAAPDKESQEGERKILPFLVNSVASAGDIVISSNEQQAVFYPKTFRVTNESIKGRIQYQAEDGSLKDVPANTFLAFERVTNNNRIGAVTIPSDGQYELRLRKEYILNWHGFPVAFHFEHEGHLHHARYETLADLYAAQQRGETVILTPDL